LAIATVFPSLERVLASKGVSGVVDLLKSAAGASASSFDDAPDRLEQEIAKCAIDAHRRRHVIIVADPCMKSDDKIERLLVRAYRRERKALRVGKTPNRARCDDWLKLIKDFQKEWADTQRKIHRKSWTPGLFGRYRAALDAVDFFGSFQLRTSP
jgi:hypothetical protein